MPGPSSVARPLVSEKRRAKTERITNITLHRTTRARLVKLMWPGEAYDVAINRLIDCYDLYRASNNRSAG